VNAGDPVWCRQRVRSGVYEDVAGEFVRATARRFIVAVWLKDGTRVNVPASPENVRRRPASSKASGDTNG